MAHNSYKWFLSILLLCFTVVASASSKKNRTHSDVSTEDVEKVSIEIVVMPNTEQDNLTISVSNSDFDFALYSNNGKQIRTATDCRNTYQLDASSLEAGEYILNIIVDENIFMKKVVVDKMQS